MQTLTFRYSAVVDKMNWNYDQLSKEGSRQKGNVRTRCGDFNLELPPQSYVRTLYRWATITSRHRCLGGWRIEP